MNTEIDNSFSKGYCTQTKTTNYGPVKNAADPIFSSHHVSVPFGCSPQEIEAALLKFIVNLVSPKEMKHITKLFFVPVGLPGMGKSTLAKHIRMSVENNLCDSKSKPHKQGMIPDDITLSLEKAFGKAVPNVSFAKVSYDRILGENLADYQAKHPEVPFHEVIDIIRSKAD